MSRLVPVLLYCLTGHTKSDGEEEPAATQVGPSSEGKVKERVKLFKKMFAEASDELPADLDSR